VTLLVPFIIYFAVLAIVSLKLRRMLFWGLILALSLPGIMKSVLLNRILSSEDIRTTALNWMHENVPMSAKIALDGKFFMPRLQPTVQQLREKATEILEGQSHQQIRLRYMIQRAEQSLEPRYQLYYLNRHPEHGDFLFARPQIPYDVTRLNEVGVRYVLIKKLRSEQGFPFYQDLRSSAKLLKRFTPYRDPSVEWSLDRFTMTGAPSLWSELFARKANGQIIEIYELIG